MTRSLYVPREFTRDPDNFGVVPVVRWIEYQPTPPARDPRVRRELELEEREWHARLTASQAQHLFAYGIRYALNDWDWTQARYAHHIGQGERRVNDVLNGKVLMRLEDIGYAHVIFGNIWDLAAGIEEL